MRRHSQIAIITIGISLFSPTVAFAQLLPDNTTGTKITPNLTIKGIPSDRIDLGTQKGNNLFHSFREFNVGSDRGVYFSNPTGVTNIFARVTGGNPSNIFGKLGILGDANLFLLNPKGILFGPNASLDLNGSLFVTSADRIRFADNSTFSAVHPEPSPLLTVSVPIGLGFGSNAGRIEIQGQGYQFKFPELFQPVDRSNSPPGLLLQSGRNATILGGDILLNGGVITAPSGNITLGSVRSGFVGLNPNGTLDYSGISDFGLIETQSAAALDASGIGGSSIHLQAGNIQLGQATLIIQNFGVQPAGNISLNATNTIAVEKNSGNIRNETVGTGTGGSIALSAKQLILRDGIGVSARSYGSATGGNIDVNVSEDVLIDGVIFSQDRRLITSSISSLALNSGRAGNVNVSTKVLRILNGAVISSTTAGIGDGGEVNVRASDRTEIIGFVPAFLIPSLITSSTFGPGKAGNVTINTRQLIVGDGGRVDASTAAIGTAGSVTINASEQVRVSGTVPGSRNPTLIISSANAIDPALAAVIGINLPLVGDSGDVTINTPKLEVTEGARVSVSNDGTGRAGNLSVNANTIALSDRGSITAASVLGGGGNIFLQARDALQLRQQAQILASAGELGNGGNIEIEAGTVTGFDRSQINANAFMGNGGNIRINTQGLFFAPNSSISASSELGISGIVAISNLDLASKNVFVSPTTNFVKVDALVSNSCLARRNITQGSFVVTGSGGLPENPYNRFVGDYPVTSIQSATDPSTTHDAQAQKLENPSQVNNQRNESDLPSLNNWQWRPGDPIIEMRGLAKTNDGRILPVLTYEDVEALVCPTKSAISH
jgi:filamentous hemagglutinin family protein